MGNVRAAFVFEGALRESIHAFKYGFQRARGRYLATLLADFLAESVEEPPAWSQVVGMPLHPRRLRQRGFNQSEILASVLSERFGIPPGRDLQRLRNTPSQVGKRMQARQDNVLGAFGWTGQPLDGQAILVVDDVITTGATLLSAMSALAEAGADRVDGLALAREEFL